MIGRPEDRAETQRWERDKERGDNEPATSVFVQWKGTDVCLDLHCVCGQHGHFDGDFAYYLRCVGCGRMYEMPHTFELAEVEGDDGPAMQDAFPGEPHPPRDGPDKVDVEGSQWP